MGGDGIVGAVAGELRDGAGLLAVVPGGRGNDFARKLGIPFDPVEAVALLETGEEKRVDLAEADGTTYLGILSAGIDSDVSRIALETRLKLGTFVYTYGVLRAIAGWKHGGLGRDDRRRAGLVRAATRSRSRTPACSAAGCTWRPTPSWTTACSRS